MRSHNGKDFERRRQQIIDGALQVFSSKGYEKATNKDIADAAVIGSPGLIYHYFKDKGDLFAQVVEQRMPLLQLLTHSEEEMMSKPLQDVLTIFSKSFLRVMENPTSLALIKVISSEAVRQPHVAVLFNQIGPGRTIGFLTRYLERQIAEGVLKPMDPRAAARCFMGSLLAYLVTREVYLQPDALQLDPDTMVATTVEIFLQGMQFSVNDNHP